MTEPASRTPRPSTEELPYIDDPVSRVWVALIVAVFGLIFVVALLFGHNGMLSPVATEAPTASPSPSGEQTPSASASPSGSPAASPSVAAPTESPTPGPS